MVITILKIIIRKLLNVSFTREYFGFLFGRIFFLIRAGTISHVIDWNNVQHFLITASATCWCSFLNKTAKGWGFASFIPFLYFSKRNISMCFGPLARQSKAIKDATLPFSNCDIILIYLWEKKKLPEQKRFIVRNHFKEVTAPYLYKNKGIFICLCVCLLWGSKQRWICLVKPLSLCLNSIL